MAHRHRVVVIGGGFAGLSVAKRLRHAKADVTLIDRRNFHLFQPLLYQVATGSLSPANIAAPLRAVLRGRKDVHIVLGDVRRIDVENRSVMLEEGDDVPYDTLVCAAGATHDYFGHDEWAEHARGLKTVEDATEIRRRVLMAFEKAARCADPAERASHLTFVVVGGGPTGVEMAGAIAEIARVVLEEELHNVDERARVVLVEGGPKLLVAFEDDLCDRTKADLEGLGVEVVLDHLVTRVDARGVDATDRETGEVETIDAETIIWAAGVKASPLGRQIADGCGVETDRAGRVPVGPDLTVAGHPEIFVVGDLAAAQDASGETLPGLGSVAAQQGKYVASAIADRLAGRTPKPFAYLDLGTMATIGRRRAVADIKGWKLTGTFAWLTWLFVHLMLLVQIPNRLLVLFQWAWSYMTLGRTARIITVTAQSEADEIDNPQIVTHRPDTSAAA